MATKPKNTDPCLNLIQSSWRLPKFRHYATLHCHMYWINPIKEFYVSYDYLKQNGLFEESAPLNPYKDIFPVLRQMLQHEDAYMRSMTGHPSKMYDEESMSQLIPLIPQGRQYLRVFSKEKTRDELLYKVTKPIFDSYGIDEASCFIIWSNVSNDTKGKPNFLHPFLMDCQKYKDYMGAVIKQHLDLLNAFKEAGQLLAEANLLPTYNNIE